jgi:hypothetical protein
MREQLHRIGWRLSKILVIYRNLPVVVVVVGK